MAVELKQKTKISSYNYYSIKLYLKYYSGSKEPGIFT